MSTRINKILTNTGQWNKKNHSYYMTNAESKMIKI